jgi:hypothetical protein
MAGQAMPAACAPCPDQIVALLELDGSAGHCSLAGCLDIGLSIAAAIPWQAGPAH